MAFDTVVVGGGVIGCTLAYYLATKGQTVAIVERSKLGSGTTANNFSWINATSKTSHAGYHKLNALGVGIYEELAAKFGADTLGLNASGSIGFSTQSDSTAFKTMQDQKKALDDFGYSNQWLDTQDLRDLEPNMRFANDAVGLLAPTDKSLDGPKFARLMAAEVQRLGGSAFENCAAEELVANDDGVVSGLATSTGAIEARNVVVTAGPDTPETLAALTGFDGFSTRFPINKIPGLLVTTPPVAKELIRHLVYTDVGGEFHVFPDFNGGLRIASDDADGALIADQSPKRLRDLAVGLLQRTQGLIPAFAGEALIDDCKIAVGVRAYPEDGLSIAGGVPGAEGLYVIATHSGITLAPALGKLMADLVVDGIVPKPLAEFGLDRLAGFG